MYIVKGKVGWGDLTMTRANLARVESTGSNRMGHDTFIYFLLEGFSSFTPAPVQKIRSTPLTTTVGSSSSTSIAPLCLLHQLETSPKRHPSGSRGAHWLRTLPSHLSLPLKFQSMAFGECADLLGVSSC